MYKKIPLGMIFKETRLIASHKKPLQRCEGFLLAIFCILALQNEVKVKGQQIMGKFIASKCRICNFEIEFKYGGNRFDYLTNCPVPAINIETDEFESVNYIVEKNNLKYKFYTHSTKG